MSLGKVEERSQGGQDLVRVVAAVLIGYGDKAVRLQPQRLATRTYTLTTFSEQLRAAS